MAEETDGIEEAFEGQLRVLVTAAGQIAERIARAREETSRRAQVTNEQAAREMQARFEAERKTAQLEVSRVHTPEWWDRATPGQMAHTYQVARAWTREDPEAARAEKTMRTEFRTRYNLDVEKTGADPAAVSAAVQEAERDRAAAAAEHQRAATETAETQLLMEQAAQEDRKVDDSRLATEHKHDPEHHAQRLSEAQSAEDRSGRVREDGRTLYDSAERRAETARELESKGIDAQTVASRMRADVSQSKPAAEAIRAGSSKVPAARKNRGARGSQVQRSGLD